MAAIFNKITYQWNSMDDTSGLSTDWLIDPTFSNQARAMEVSPKYWTYDGNIITALTEEEILANSTFLTEFQNDAWELIKNERDRRKLEGGYQAASNWYHSDTTSRIQQIGLLLLGANIPANLYWKTMSGSFVLMTQTLAAQIFQAAAASDVAIFTVAEQKKAAMMVSSDPRTYNHLTGWPLSYGE